MSVPDLRLVVTDAAKARALAEAIGSDFAALHPAAYQRPTAADRAARAGGFSDPTGSAETSQRVVRGKLEDAAVNLGQGLKFLATAAAELTSVANLVDHDARHRPDDTSAVTPRQVHSVELAELRANQAHRDALASLAVLKRARADAGKERAKAKAQEAARAAQEAARQRKADAKRRKGRAA